MAEFDNNPDPQEMTAAVNWEIMSPTKTLGDGVNLGSDNFDTPTQSNHSLGPTSAGSETPAMETDGRV